MGRELPHDSDKVFLVYAGTGTDLIFNRGIDLPGFASFPLLEKPDTRKVLAEQMRELASLAGETGFGCILETPTWMANADRARPLGYDAQQIEAVNRDAVDLIDAVRQETGRDDVLVSACIGPRYDPYADIPAISVAEARTYHIAQLSVLKDTAVDLATAYTFNRPSEAAGCLLAARDVGLPMIMSLVVETDGCLADGTPLIDAVEEIDEITEGYALFFMVNCAHPTHFGHAIAAHPRLRGVVANASVCSHAELDEATELDEGDPDQLGRDVAQILKANPAIKVIGGCCGTDMRHLRRMIVEVSAG